MLYGQHRIEMECIKRNNKSSTKFVSTCKEYLRKKEKNIQR